MTARARTALIVASVALAIGGCGYHDDNPEAAVVVAQAFYDAYGKGDESMACRVLSSDLRALVASRAEGNCEAAVRAQFKHGAKVARVQGVSGSDTVAHVTVRGNPHEFVTLLRYGSVWRIVETPRMSAPTG
jgi:hypothetical protein